MFFAQVSALCHGASQSSAVRRRRKRGKACFPAACTSENTPLRPQVCAHPRMRAAACIPFEKMLAFLRAEKELKKGDK